MPKPEFKRRGAIINISSDSGLTPEPFLAVYSATKAYLDFFSRALQSEYEDKGITVQVVYPGPVFTDMLKGLSDDIQTSNFLVPRADVYARHALNTLAFTSATTGYWSHALWLLFYPQRPSIRRAFNAWSREMSLEAKKRV